MTTHLSHSRRVLGWCLAVAAVAAFPVALFAQAPNAPMSPEEEMALAEGAGPASLLTVASNRDVVLPKRLAEVMLAAASGDEVVVLVLFGIDYRGHRSPPRVADRAWRKPRMPVGVVRVFPVVQHGPGDPAVVPVARGRRRGHRRATVLDRRVGL